MQYSKITPWYNYHTANFTRTKKNAWEHVPDFVVQDALVTLKQLPLGKTYKQFKKKILALIEQQVIVDIIDPIADQFIEQVQITFDKTYEKDKIIELLNLKKKLSFDNAYLFFEEANHPVLFDSVESILKAYVKKGLELYQKYKDYQLFELRKQHEYLRFKRIYI